MSMYLIVYTIVHCTLFEVVLFMGCSYRRALMNKEAVVMWLLCYTYTMLHNAAAVVLSHPNGIYVLVLIL